MDFGPSWRRELVFDHAFVLVRDLEAADARIRAEFGLQTVAGGTFPDHAGLANRLVPMQEGFLELLSVVDRSASSDAARHWMEQLDRFGEHIAGWALRTDRLVDAAADLGFEPEGPDRWAPEGGGPLCRWSVIWPDDDAAKHAVPDRMGGLRNPYARSWTGG